MALASLHSDMRADSRIRPPESVRHSDLSACGHSRFSYLSPQPPLKQSLGAVLWSHLLLLVSMSWLRPRRSLAAALREPPAPLRCYLHFTTCDCDRAGLRSPFLCRAAILGSQDALSHRQSTGSSARNSKLLVFDTVIAPPVSSAQRGLSSIFRLPSATADTRPERRFRT